MIVCVLGAGYVGLVTSACLAELGHDVRVLDIDEQLIEKLRSHQPPFSEPGLRELLEANTDRMTFDLSPHGIKGAEVVVIAVGTPSSPTGAANLNYVHDAVALIAAEADPGTTVVMKSTVPPGTGAGMISELEIAGCAYASNPEFLREGSAITDFFETDRIVVGAMDPSTFKTLRALYQGIEAPLIECDVASAEMIKYASNAFLATKISFINEIASVCGLVGADIDQVADGVGMDRRIGAGFLKAGIGYGGSCFPKDTRALDFLAGNAGYDFRLLKAVIEVNTHQRLLPLRTLEARFGDLGGRRIAILGIAFKPYTDDTRESPALDILSRLEAAGAQVTTHDPESVLPAGVAATQHADVYAALEGAEAVIVAVEWPLYREIDWNRAAAALSPGALVFDGRNWLDRAQVEAAGLAYAGVGR